MSLLESTERRSRAVLRLCGLIVLLVGLMVLIGWHSRNELLIRLSASYVAMAYNTAICFVAAGLALLATAAGQGRVVRWCSLVPLAIGLLSILEYAVGLNLGVDFNFSGFLTATHTDFPGRMAPNTALCCALIGAGLLLMSESRPRSVRPKALMLLGPVVVALGAVATFGYLTRIETAYRWGQAHQMALHTALCILVAGVGICAFAWRDSRRSGLQPTWVPVFVALGMTVGTLLLWQALSSQEQTVVHETIEAQAALVRNEVQSRMEARVLALGRTAARIIRLEDWSENEFNLDAQLLLNDYAGFQAVEFIDPEYRVQWVYPERGNEPVIGFNMLRNETRREMLRESHRRRTPLISHAIPLLQGGEGLILYLPMARGDVFLGFVVGVMRIDELFDTVLDPRYIAPGYNIEVRDANGPVVQRQTAPSLPGTPVAEVPLLVAGTTWRGLISPTPAQLHRLNNPLPDVVLITGLCLAWLLGLAVYLAQNGAARAREAEGANLALAQEIEVRKQAEAALTRRTKELSRSNADLEQFAYVASHDLQEPLRMVASYLQLLERRYRDQLDDEAREFIDFAVDGATRMRTLINDLLLYSRVGTRGKPFELTDLNDLAAQVLDNLAVAIEETGAAVTVAQLPTVNVDPVQISQVLQNLIGNALKFRDQSPPRIEVAAAPQDGGWRIDVTDNGIGVPAQYADRVFMIFQRLHSRAEYEGTGIGLAVCKKIVERHGGRIGVDANEGQGSRFWFTLPQAEETLSE